MPNVYDFDNTVAGFDSGSAFILFCLRRHPGLLRFLPRTLAQLVRFAVKRHRGPAKGEFYRLLRALPGWREEVRLFWQAKAEAKLRPWYLAQLRPDDIIISCSPEFLLRPLCDQLGVRLIATRVNTETGLLEGFSCYGAEKVRRLREDFGEIEINEFYSDSLSDAPLAALARRAFLVKGDRRTAWPEG